MELMEDGNLMDRVQILLQRDLGYYEEHQTVLQENLCLGAVGGPFDFPRYASFVAVKLVQWWEEEFRSCFHHPSGLVEPNPEPAHAEAHGEELTVVISCYFAPPTR
jgi:protein KIAA0825